MLLGAEPTVKFTPLLAIPPTVTTTLPVVAPPGTDATMLVALQLVVVAVVPLKVTVPVVPKVVPVMVTAVPTGPVVGFRLVMAGADEVTVKLTPLLAIPPTVTTTFPVVAPLGTDATMLVALQLVVVAVVRLRLTLPDVPKFVPVMVTAVPTGPEVGFRLVMAGADEVTVKFTPLLATPPTVTTTLPVVAPLGTDATMLVALQLVVLAVVPLKVTVPVVPKLVPVMVTPVPTGPVVGFRLVMAGAEEVTVKFTPLLAIPPTVTTTLPVVAPLGTDATMLVALQLVVVAVVPLKVNVPVEPKLVPVMVTAVPTGPVVGFRLVMAGAVPPPLLAAPMPPSA